MRIFSPSTWSIAWRVRLGMLIVPVILLGLASFQLRASHIVNEHYRAILYHAGLLLTAQNMMHGIENMEGERADFIASQAPASWERYQQNKNSVDRNYRESLARATSDSNIDQKLKDFYSAHLQWREQIAEPAMEAARAGRRRFARTIAARSTLAPQRAAYSALRQTAVDVRQRRITEADELRRWSTQWLVAFEAIALVLTMILIAGIVRIVTQPMNELVRQSRRIQTGDYSPNLKVRSDEFGRVIHAMNDMSAAVREREQELKLTRDALAKSSEELRKKNQELEEFVYSVSHDLKAPIISMQGYLAALQADHRASLNDEAQFFVERAVANSEHLQSLIADLINLSRIGRVGEPPETFDSLRLVQQVVGELQPQAAAKDVGIEIAGNLPLVFGERKQLYQVFINLIDNAIKYSDASQVQRTVRIECTENESEWCFVVRDNGIGINPKHREKVFNIFQRAGNSKEPGTGIGLSIVKRTAETHGGRAWAEASGNGAGSAFFFTIAKPHGNNAGEGQAGVLQPAEERHDTDGTKVAYPKIGGVA